MNNFDELKQKISDYVDAHIDELVADTVELMKIDSSRAEAKEGKPYGDGPAKALEVGLNIMNKYGFKTTNYDNYVITADLNDKEKGLDVLAHLDVVPGGEGWTVTEPFKPVIIDGKLIGRGSMDDKGPAMAALLAMRTVKDLKLPLSKNVRLILGSDEECGSSDIEYYFTKEKFAPMTFSPDANYPVVNVEKGRFCSDIKAEYKVGRIKALHSGKTANVVPSKAFAIIENLTEAEKAVAEKRAKELKVDIVFEDGGIMRIDGVSAHASLPEMGNNAATAILDIVSKLGIDEEASKFIASLAKMFPHGDGFGGGLGVKMSDDISGALTMSLDIVDIEDGKLTATFDCRASVCATKENLVDVTEKAVTDAGMKLDIKGFSKPHNADGNSDFVKTLLMAYECYMGVKGEPMAIGGGTYVHDIENGVAFGCEIEGIDNHMHGPDEFADIEVLKKSAKIFALSIAELCK